MTLSTLDSGISSLLTPPRMRPAFVRRRTMNQLDCEFATGLDAATRAIYYAEREVCDSKLLAELVQENSSDKHDIETMSISGRNATLASTTRAVASKSGWFAGWKCLAQACPDCGMHDVLMDDVKTCIDVFNKVTVSTKIRTLMPIKFSVVASPGIDRIDQVGGKTTGGKNWESDNAYQQAMAAWNVPIDLIIGPCAVFAWIAVSKKVEEFKDAETATEFWTAQLLGIVDYDMDKDKQKLPGGLTAAIDRTAKMAVGYEGRMRGSAWIGMMTMDQQTYNRETQLKWVAEGRGSFINGPEQISGITPGEFAAAGYVDCAALAPFAYQTAEELGPSRMAMFVAVILANMHDFLFDMGCSSRISLAGYAAATDAFEYDLPQAFVIGFIDEMAKRNLNGPSDQKPFYGDNALYATCVWDNFNVRYRAWERFVKYTRLLQRSDSPTAAGLLRNAKEGKILVPDIEEGDLDVAFRQALDTKNVEKLVSRKDHTQMYKLSDPAGHLEKHCMTAPGLCPSCTTGFTDAFLNTHDEVEAIPGLPNTVVSSAPVALAAAIRRGSCWATTSDCCDKCACTIGMWANVMSDRAVVALMLEEREVSSRDWLLQNYLMGCVAFSPLRLISILVGFDVTADITFEEGAMGVRDVLDE